MGPLLYEPAAEGGSVLLREMSETWLEESHYYSSVDIIHICTCRIQATRQLCALTNAVMLILQACALRMHGANQYSVNWRVWPIHYVNCGWGT